MTDDNETVIVTRKIEKNVVVMSLDNMMESLRILKNPSYFIELFQSLQQLQQGGIVIKTIEELEAAEQ